MVLELFSLFLGGGKGGLSDGIAMLNELWESFFEEWGGCGSVRRELLRWVFEAAV